MFNANTPGGICRDLLGWASVLGRLAQDYPHLVAIGIDDFLNHLEPYSVESIAELQSRMRSQAPWMSFVPTAYYRNFTEQSLPDITRSFDTMLFYFRNESHGDCLTDPCGLNSIPNAPGEIDFMKAQLPAGRTLQVGTYWTTLWGPTKGEYPSNQYDHDLTQLVLGLPGVDGVTAYSMSEIMSHRVQPASAGHLVCDDSNYLQDRYCTLRKVFGDHLPLLPSFAKALTGDFNADGRSDIALAGKSGWTTIPVAFSNGDGTFSVTNAYSPDFALWAAVAHVKPITGDFNKDGRSDIALVGGAAAGWTTLPVAFSNGNGTFTVTNAFIGDFSLWSSVAHVKALAGDFSKDGRADVALIGGPGWTTVPVAFSNGDGTFRITNAFIGDFATWGTGVGR